MWAYESSFYYCYNFPRSLKIVKIKKNIKSESIRYTSIIIYLKHQFASKL